MAAHLELPFSQACENNKQPILDILRRHLQGTQRVFEIGSGTGQHALHFAAALPHLVWQCSDLDINTSGLATRQKRVDLANLPPPLHFDVAEPNWPAACDAIFSANTLHIMPWPLGIKLLSGAGEYLPGGGLLMVYGPFKYGGQFTSASNLEFDLRLKRQSPTQGISDFELVVSEALAARMELIEDNAMPANNQLLVFRKAPRGTNSSEPSPPGL